MKVKEGTLIKRNKKKIIINFASLVVVVLLETFVANLQIVPPTSKETNPSGRK